MNKNDYKNPYGHWKVTTEGDVEGRSTSHLGDYTGYVDEIALFLADKCYYTLTFNKIELPKVLKPTAQEVNIAFEIDSKTWDMKPKDRVKYFEEVFKDRPNIHVKEGQYYASVKIETSDKVTTKKDHIESGLAKLSYEEKKALGLL